jgi:hypothetical protein
MNKSSRKTFKRLDFDVWVMVLNCSESKFEIITDFLGDKLNITITNKWRLKNLQMIFLAIIYYFFDKFSLKKSGFAVRIFWVHFVVFFN